jgi:hypothetical protein
VMNGLNDRYGQGTVARGIFELLGLGADFLGTRMERSMDE